MSIAFDKRDYRNPLDEEEILHDTSEEDDEVSLQQQHSYAGAGAGAAATSRRPPGVAYNIILRWDGIQTYCQQNSLPLFDRCSSLQLANFMNRYMSSYDD